MKIASLILILYALCACGVKGDPVPPATPAEFSRGQQPSSAIEKAPPALQRDNRHDSDDSDDSDY